MRASALGLSLWIAGCTTMPMAIEAPGAAGTGAAGGRILTQLPCDVNAVLVANCQSCHGAWPSSGVGRRRHADGQLPRPWREVPKSTDAWYIVDEEAVAAPPEPRRRWVALVGGGVVVALALGFLVARSHAREAAHVPAVVTAPPAAELPVATPPAVAAPAPIPTSHRALAGTRPARPPTKKHRHRR